MKDLSNNIYLLEEFLFEKIDGLEKIVTSDISSKVFIHGHCHQRSLNHFESVLDLLKRFGFEVENSNAGCCGMAGSFGYESEHFEVVSSYTSIRPWTMMIHPDNTSLTSLTPPCSIR